MDVLKKKRAEKEAYLKLLTESSGKPANDVDESQIVYESPSEAASNSNQFLRPTVEPITSHTAHVDKTISHTTISPELPPYSPKQAPTAVIRGQGLRELLGEQSPEQSASRMAKRAELSKLLQDQMDDDKRRKEIHKKEQEEQDKRDEERITREEDITAKKRDDERLKIEDDRAKREMAANAVAVKVEQPKQRKMKEQLSEPPPIRAEPQRPKFIEKAVSISPTVPDVIEELPLPSELMVSAVSRQEPEIRSMATFQNMAMVEQLRFENDFLKREQFSNRDMIEMLQRRMTLLEHENHVQRQEMSDLRQMLSERRNKPEPKEYSTISLPPIKQAPQVVEAVKPAQDKPPPPKLSARRSSLYDATSFELNVDFPLTKPETDVDNNESGDELAKTLQGESEFLYPDGKPFMAVANQKKTTTKKGK